MKQTGTIGFAMAATLLTACGRIQTSVARDARHAICDDHFSIATSARTFERQHPKERFRVLSETAPRTGWTAITMTRVMDPSALRIDDETRESLLVSFSGELRSIDGSLNNDSLCTVLVHGTAFGPGHVKAVRPAVGSVKIEGDQLTIDIEAGTPEVLYGRAVSPIERTRFRVNL